MMLYAAISTQRAYIELRTGNSECALSSILRQSENTHFHANIEHTPEY